MIIFALVLLAAGLAIGVYLLTRPPLSAALDREGGAFGETLLSSVLPKQEDIGEPVSAVRQEQRAPVSDYSAARTDAVAATKEQKGAELLKENEALRKESASLKTELDVTKTALARTLNASKERELMKEKETFIKEVASLKSRLVQMEQEASALRHSLQKSKPEDAPADIGPEALKKKEEAVQSIPVVDTIKKDEAEPGEQKRPNVPPLIPERPE